MNNIKFVVVASVLAGLLVDDFNYEVIMNLLDKYNFSDEAAITNEYACDSRGYE